MAVLDHQLGLGGQEKPGLLAGIGVFDQPAVGVPHGHLGPPVGFGVFQHHPAGEAGFLVQLLPHGHPVDDVGELHDARHVGEDGRGEWIPLGDLLPLLDDARVLDPQHRAHRQGARLQLAAGFGIDDARLGLAGHDGPEALLILHDADVDVLQASGELGLPPAHLDPLVGRAADVEGAHGQLGAGLADALGGDHPHRLAFGDEPPAGEVAPVAQGADAVVHIAGKHRADVHRFDAGIFDELHLVLVDLVAGFYQQRVAEGIGNVFQRNPAQHPVAQGLDDLARLDQRRHFDSVHRAAVVIPHHAVLGHVHQPPSEVAGVGRLERRIGQPLARAVGGDEVLQHTQPLAEVGRDGRLDDFSGGLGHQPAHAGQLLHLLGAAPGAGIGHDIDRVDLAVRLDRVGAQGVQHLVGHAVREPGPNIDHLVVALAFGDEAVHVLLPHLDHLLLSVGQEGGLVRGNLHVVNGDGEPGPGRMEEAQPLEFVQHGHGLHVAGQPVGHVDQVRQLLLFQQPVDVAELHCLRDVRPQEHPAHGGIDLLALHDHFDLGLQPHLAVVVGHLHVVAADESHALADGAGDLLRHPVQPQHHVLGGGHDGLAVGRAEDVVRRHHQHLGLQLGFHRQRHVHRHLVAVEVRIERRADQRVQLDRLALDEDRLERLNPQPVQGRRPVQQNRMIDDDLVQHLPNLRPPFLDHLLGHLDRRHIVVLDQ